MILMVKKGKITGKKNFTDTEFSGKLCINYSMARLN